MQERYVLVTGSSRGLGFEIAKQLSYSGYHIILTGRDKKKLHSSLKKLNPNLKHIYIKVDFSKSNFLKKIKIKINTIKIFAVVHNYGVNFKMDTHPINLDILEKSIYNNFIVSLKINEYLINNFKEYISKIIYVSSTATLHAKASPSYVISKGMINSYVKNISQEYLNKNIFICAVLPGILAHKGSNWREKKATDYERYREVQKRQPLGKFAKPLDIAEYIVNILNQKSFMLTGSLLKLDANEY